MQTRAKLNETAKLLEEAEQAVRDAKEAHREAFRRALAALFDDYGLCLEANGTEGARIEIETLGAPAYDVRRLPE